MQKILYRGAAVISIDGKIGLHSQHFTDWSSPEDKIAFRKLLNSSDVVIAGHATYRVAQKFLDKRNCIVFTRSVRTTVQHKKTILFCNPKNVRIDALVKKLRYHVVTIIGGAQTFSYFLKNAMLDELYLTVEPIIFGRGISLFDDVKIPLANFALTKSKKLNKKGSVLLMYTRQPTQ